MATGWWAVVFFAVVAVLAAVWVGNTVRWTRANGNLARRSSRAVGPQDKTMDVDNHRVTSGGQQQHTAGAGRHGLRLVASIVLTGIAVVGLVWSILYAVAS